MWISEENENCQGQKDCKSQAQRGQKEPHRLRYTFPPSARLRKRYDYQRLSRNGDRLQGKLVSFDYHTEGVLSPRLGITVSKKYGKAPLRNRFKRIVREAFREIRALLPQGLNVNVHPRLRGEKLSKIDVLEDFRLILHAEPRTKKSS